MMTTILNTIRGTAKRAALVLLRLCAKNKDMETYLVTAFVQRLSDLPFLPLPQDPAQARQSLLDQRSHD